MPFSKIQSRLNPTWPCPVPDACFSNFTNLSGTVLFQSYLEHITRNIKEYCLPTVSFMSISLNHPKNLPNICYSYHKTTISITSTSYGKTQDVSSTPNSCVVCVPWCTWHRTSPCGIATLIDGGVVRTLVSIRPKIRMEWVMELGKVTNQPINMLILSNMDTKEIEKPILYTIVWSFKILIVLVTLSLGT